MTRGREGRAAARPLPAERRDQGALRGRDGKRPTVTANASHVLHRSKGPGSSPRRRTSSSSSGSWPPSRSAPAAARLATAGLAAPRLLVAGLSPRRPGRCPPRGRAFRSTGRRPPGRRDRPARRRRRGGQFGALGQVVANNSADGGCRDDRAGAPPSRRSHRDLRRRRHVFAARHRRGPVTAALLRGDRHRAAPPHRRGPLAHHGRECRLHDGPGRRRGRASAGSSSPRPGTCRAPSEPSAQAGFPVEAYPVDAGPAAAPVCGALSPSRPRGCGASISRQGMGRAPRLSLHRPHERIVPATGPADRMLPAISGSSAGRDHRSSRTAARASEANWRRHITNSTAAVPTMKSVGARRTSRDRRARRRRRAGRG